METFSDRRMPKSTERGEFPQSHLGVDELVSFDVTVRRADGSRQRVTEQCPSRFIAARLAEERVQAETRAKAVAESVSLRLTGKLMHVAADESQAPVDHFVTVSDGNGAMHMVRVAEQRRSAAIAAAEAERPGSRAVSVVLRYPILGRCGYCNVHVFVDVKSRRHGAGWKCYDCF